MSEIIDGKKRNDSFRHHLLTNASLLALLGTAFVPPVALAADEDRSTVWIDLGGQLERVDTPQTILAPRFFDFASPQVLNTMVGAQRPSRYSTGAEGKVTFEPEATGWVLSAAIRYGRVKNARHLHYQTPGLPTFTNIGLNSPLHIKPTLRNFGDGQGDLAESHFVLDFQAGRDVGLGIFGYGTSSVVSAGVRYAQFTSSSATTIHARPVLGYSPPVISGAGSKYNKIHHPYHQTYTALVHTERSTHAIGPSLSWDASVPVLGSGQGMMVAFDWGMNAAVLFGRQRAREDHQTTGNYSHWNGNVKVTGHYAQSTAHGRSHAVTIPNVGGFAGLSLKFPNARINLGYRGDFFFKATDAGLDTRDTANRNFYGPFAKISIGLGR